MKQTESERSHLLLLDTHTLVWMVEHGARLGTQTARMLDEFALLNCLALSAITPWEVALLVSKKRLTLSMDVMSWVGEALAKPGVRLLGLEPEIAVNSALLPFEMHADPADRILVATARQYGATLVTADRLLLELAAQGHLRAMDATA